ncbi:unnamed protein product [Alopecurus aequalis]
MLIRRTLSRLASVKDRVVDAAKQAVKGDEHFPSLKGHPAARVHARESAENQAGLATAEEEKERGGKASTVKEFQIYRWNPDKPGRPFLQSYFVDLGTCGPLKIKSEHDSTLVFRRSCREGICGSCSMNVDGVNTVACLKPVDTDTSTATMITPLPHMYVVKDLVVDMTNFYQQYKSVEPWLKTKRPAAEGREHAQSPGERKKLDGLYECILCACCGVPVLLVELGGLPRPRRAAPRIPLGLRQALTEGWDKLYRCRMIKSCTATCPKSLDPAAAISALKAMHQLRKP